MSRAVIQSIVAVAAVILIGLVWLQRDIEAYLHTPIDLPQPISAYTIRPHTPFQVVLDELVAQHIIDRPYYLEYAVRKKNLAHKIKAGEYLIQGPITPLELIDLFVAGDVIQHSLTLLEGWSYKQVINAVASQSALRHTLISTEQQAVLSKLQIAAPSAEGMFLPETYRFPAGTTDVAFLQRTHRALMRTLHKEWNKRQPDLPYKTPYQALIMASLIEKETGRADEFARIAGVFTRRLKKSMKLQTDPTVIYALGENYDRNIRKRDLSIDSRYNTYLYKGLPPTPIALAGEKTIRAALHPDIGSALYFVSRGDGSHHFSDTLQEHNKAVTKYQLKK